MFKILSTYICCKKIYIKCNIWTVAVRPSYIQDARFLKVKPICNLFVILTLFHNVNNLLLEEKSEGAECLRIRSAMCLSYRFVSSAWVQSKVHKSARFIFQCLTSVTTKFSAFKDVALCILLKFRRFSEVSVAFNGGNWFF